MSMKNVRDEQHLIQYDTNTNTNNGTARPRARWGTATLRSIVPNQACCVLVSNGEVR